LEDACGENYIVSNYSEILHDESVHERALCRKEGLLTSLRKSWSGSRAEHSASGYRGAVAIPEPQVQR
jgi:hypothetical protein